MKARVDADRCMGHGMCHALAPQVFQINDDTGFNEMGEFEVPADLVEAARRGQAACPERSITLLADTPVPGATATSRRSAA